MSQLDPYHPLTGRHLIVDNYHTFGDYQLAFSDMPNMSSIERANRTMAKAYWAEHWYPGLQGITPRSRLIELSKDDIHSLVEEGGVTMQLWQQLQAALDDGLHFIRSSGKSSHSRKPVYTLTDCRDELTNASVIMTFKYGCRYVMMREWVNIEAEYRVYVYQGMVRYMEEYISPDGQLIDPAHYRRLKEILTLLGWTVAQRVPYEDFTVDIGLTDDGRWIVIEVNTPLYLYAGLMLAKYAWERDRIHTTTSPIFRYKVAGEIEEI